jgi:hypothetical protein
LPLNRSRELCVLEIEDPLTASGLPSLNCYAESAISTVRREVPRWRDNGQLAVVIGPADSPGQHVAEPIRVYIAGAAMEL